ncbi:DNA polymerase IV [Mumia zhuanghuii]|uniref:DNA polymerase IV n=1 Tax=Mumia zhuanghuii TaxID=2585211 RepID=A0A5C4MK65_9ACTN|nr:DNA polymerase IV [Mumia zhuanghuii]TNC36100.1 DNA polymerase IV [Mumia zhuanghuii]TNC43740.1 DNA polymerase IV [Mumia zhuanghuii]
MRRQATVLHLDLDAFFAAVEQRDKPSLRGKPVVVGGLGPRGVVSTASYEARTYGIRSAMRTAEARARCPHAAYLSDRFDAYRDASRVVMERLREISPLVEPLSLDEAFVDLAAGEASRSLDLDGARALAEQVRADIADRTGGLTASVGIASSKFLAKIASELAKPDGVHVVEPGTELDVLAPMSVRAIPGVGPATAERLRRLGVHTVEDLRGLEAVELTSLLGTAYGTSLHALARGVDHRAVVAERETKSLSVEDTFETDITDPRVLADIATTMSRRLSDRLRERGMSGRTVTLKIRHHDFETHTRSATLAGPTDDARTIARTATGLLTEIDSSSGLRLLGVGVSGMADWVQDDLFVADEEPDGGAEPELTSVAGASARPRTRWPAGADVVHAELGPGWVWGSGLGRVTVRFETRTSGPGPVRTFAADDPSLTPGTVEP